MSICRLAYHPTYILCYNNGRLPVDVFIFLSIYSTYNNVHVCLSTCQSSYLYTVHITVNVYLFSYLYICTVHLLMSTTACRLSIFLSTIYTVQLCTNVHVYLSTCPSFYLYTLHIIMFRSAC